MDLTQIDQAALITLLLAGIQLGGQYVMPGAALLRALWYGWQGKFPEGAWQIAGASFVAGLTSLTDAQTLTSDTLLRTVVVQLTGNAVFTAGLLAFIVAYLFRQTQNMSRQVDGLVGAAMGLVVWGVWTFILGEWAWWMVFLAVPAGAALLIALRALMFVIALALKIARYMLIAAVAFMLVGAVLVALQLAPLVVAQFAGTPTP